MFAKKYGYYYSYIVILLAFIISGYLLYYHLSIVAGNFPESDHCSVIFGKGCLVATLSRFSVFMKIPVGGWGIIYLVILLCLITFSQLFNSGESDEFIQIAFWISFVGALVSLFFILLMIAFSHLFCPYCSIFHLLNFTLFFIIKKLTEKPFSQLLSDLVKALTNFFLAKPMSEQFNKLKWMAFIFPIILSLAVYQWILMQEQNIKIEKLSDYDPLKEIEQFELNEIFELQSSPDDPLYGAADAPVSLVVFSDFQCSMCNMFASNFKYLIDYNKEKLNIRFKYFPLSSTCNSLIEENFHPLACESARASEAARLQGKFWEYHDSLFAMGTLKDKEQLFDIAKMLNLDMDKFKVDYNSEACSNKINQDIQEGIRLKIEGTPTAFLNGRKLNKLSENNINLLVKFLD